MKKVFFTILTFLGVILVFAVLVFGSKTPTDQYEMELVEPTELEISDLPTAVPPTQAIPVERHTNPWSIVQTNDYSMMIATATPTTLYSLAYDSRAPKYWHVVVVRKQTQVRFVITHIVIDNKVELSCLPEDETFTDCIGAVNESGDQVWGITVPPAAVPLFKQGKEITLIFEQADGSSFGVVLSTVDLGKMIELIEAELEPEPVSRSSPDVLV